VGKFLIRRWVFVFGYSGFSVEEYSRQRIYFTTKWATILRSPAENENGGLSFHMVPSSTRHSRARGNPGLLRRISLDTRFRGYDGTQAGLFVLIPKRVFSKEDTKSTKLRSLEISISETFVSFVIFVVNDSKW
jgi:hypothetical protein